MAGKKTSPVCGSIDPDMLYTVDELAFVLRISVDNFKRKYLWTDAVPYCGEGNDILIPGFAMVQYAARTLRRHSERNEGGSAE